MIYARCSRGSNPNRERILLFPDWTDCLVLSGPWHGWEWSAARAAAGSGAPGDGRRLPDGAGAGGAAVLERRLRLLEKQQCGPGTPGRTVSCSVATSPGKILGCGKYSCLKLIEPGKNLNKHRNVEGKCFIPK